VPEAEKPYGSSLNLSHVKIWYVEKRRDLEDQQCNCWSLHKHSGLRTSTACVVSEISERVLPTGSANHVPLLS